MREDDYLILGLLIFAITIGVRIYRSNKKESKRFQQLVMALNQKIDITNTIDELKTLYYTEWIYLFTQSDRDSEKDREIQLLAIKILEKIVKLKETKT